MDETARLWLRGLVTEAVRPWTSAGDWPESLNNLGTRFRQGPTEIARDRAWERYITGLKQELEVRAMMEEVRAATKLGAREVLELIDGAFRTLGAKHAEQRACFHKATSKAAIDPENLPPPAPNYYALLRCIYARAPLTPELVGQLKAVGEDRKRMQDFIATVTPILRRMAAPEAKAAQGGDLLNPQVPSPSKTNPPRPNSPRKNFAPKHVERKAGPPPFVRTRKDLRELEGAVRRVQGSQGQPLLELASQEVRMAHAKLEALVEPRTGTHDAAAKRNALAARKELEGDITLEKVDFALANLYLMSQSAEARLYPHIQIVRDWLLSARDMIKRSGESTGA
jgi:hypothetical protein